MLTIDTNKLATFLGLRREVTGGVHIYETLPDGSGSSVTRTLLPSETLAGFTIENSVPKGKFFGFAVSQQLTIEIVNELLTLEKGTQLQPYLSIKDAVDCPTLPYFYVDTVEHDTVKKTTKITAYDAIYLASKRQISEVSIEYPTTLLNYATAVVNALNCVLSAGLNINPVFTQETVNVDGTETLQEILGALAEASGSICFCSSANTIVFKQLSKTPEDAILPATYFNFASQEPIVLTKIASATQLGDNYISGEDEGYTQTLWDNPFLELREDVATIVDTIQQSVCPLQMTPYTLESRGNPYYEIGDCITIHTPTGEHKIYWFNETLQYNGGLRSKTSWEAGEDEKPDANPTNLGEALSMTYAKVDKANKAIAIVASKADENEANIAALDITTQGISATVAGVQTHIDDAINGVNADIAELNKTVTAKMNEEQVQLMIDSTMREGVSSITTTTGFTFNEDGLTIDKTGSEMKTIIDEDGMTIERNANQVLVANNEGVDAYNLHASTYLIIGDNSRFEDYNNDSRTGCFWIGK